MSVSGATVPKKAQFRTAGRGTKKLGPSQELIDRSPDSVREGPCPTSVGPGSVAEYNRPGASPFPNVRQRSMHLERGENIESKKDKRRRINYSL